MKVKLLRYTPEGERLISSAAKLCYSPVGVEEIEEDLTEEKVEKFLSRLVSMGHESPIEHISFTFAAEGVSRSLTHQLVRHRLASYSQQSQRYVREDQFDYIIPKEIEELDEAREIYIEKMKKDQETYDKLVQLLMENGRDEKQAIEDARYVLPNGAETKIVLTMNARSLLHFFRLRTCERAQREIRDLAIEMLRQVKEVYPIIFKNAGPSCIGGPCPEGKMTCGRIGEIREKFMSI